jgi:glutaredoxin
MSKRKVEVFTAGCPVCADLENLVKDTACPDCELTIYNLNKGEGVEESKKYGITTVPAVVVNGRLLDCCRRNRITKEDLLAAGIGKPL